GIIHRDIKPANLLLAGNGVVKLSDFGIAKLFGNTGLTADGGLLGTAEYMAPEQADGRPVGYRCDLYSLGGVLYAMMAGHPPFRAKSLPEMLQMQRFTQPDPLRRHVPEVPAEIEEIVQTLLEKDAERRVPTAFVLGRRLEATRLGLAHQQAVINAEVSDQSATAEAPPKLLGAVTNEPHGARLSLQRTVPVIAAEDAAAGLPPTADATAPPAEAAGPATIHLAPHAASLIGADVIPIVTDRSESAQGASRADRASGEVSNGHGQAIALGGVANRRKFTVVSRDERSSDAIIEDQAEWISPQTWLLVLGMLAVGAVAWWFLQPPSADSLYHRISAAAQENKPEALAAVDDDIARFLAIYPHDPRNRDVFQYQQQIEQYRLERKFARRARQGDRSSSETAIERAYFDAMAYRDVEPLLCRRKLQAILDLYDAESVDEQPTVERQCVLLARRQLERLDEQLNRHTAADEQSLAGRLAAARKLSSSDAAAARRIWQAVVELYGDRAWASAMVDEARRRLSESSDER
ncbi:MAG TPA: serine/threonine-protein kinase, partial [Pirellulales bacterium]|nr:serine/threonine-protein kinase [Pirellulales bacterium]